MQINKLILLFLFLIGSLQLMAETLDLDGKRIELVNGTITNRDAKIVFTKYHSLYKRGKYYDAKSIMDKFIRYYKGNKLPEAYFFLAKAKYMNGDIEGAYRDFLNLYDTYPNSRIVKKGMLKKVLAKICNKNLNKIKSFDDISNGLPIFDNTIKYIVLYSHITNNNKFKKEFEKLLKSKPSYKRNIIFDNNYYYNISSIKKYKINNKIIREPEFFGDWKAQFNYNKRYFWYSPTAQFIYNMIIGDALSTIVSRELMYLSNKNFETYYAAIGEENYYRYYGKSGFRNVDFSYSTFKDRAEFFTKGYSEKRREGMQKPNLLYYIKRIKKEKKHLELGQNNYWIQIKIGWSYDYPSKYYTDCTAIFPSLKELIIAKHGSLYDWVGLKRVDDAL